MVQFLALVRTLAEVLRLHHIGPLGPPAGVIDRYVVGALVAAVGCWVAVGLFILQRHRATTAVAAITIVALLVYKVLYLR
jgi:hypothetical protein